MSNYLVTGAAGFIASRVIEMLLDEGHTVIGLDSMNDAYDVRIKYWRLDRLNKRTGFKFQKVDISDWQQVWEILAQCDGNHFAKLDGIINLAARAGVRQSIEDPWVYVNTNVLGTLNLLESAKRLEVPKFVLASTSSLYGMNPPIPTPETALDNHPMQVYAASKKGAEALCYSYHYLNKIDVTVLRYFTVYGPAGRPDLSMFRFVQWIAEDRVVRINGDGEQSRGFTYLDDIAQGTILALKPVGHELINLGGYETIKIIDLVRMLERLIGKKANIQHMPFHPADIKENLANVEKAKNILGWEPKTPLKDGVPNLVNWYMTERSWASLIDTKN